MNEKKLIDKLRQTLRWRPKVEKTAASFAGVSGDEYEQLIRRLIESGDDKALGILLCVCGVNSVTVDPQVLAEAFGGLSHAEPHPCERVVPRGGRRDVLLDEAAAALISSSPSRPAETESSD